MVASSPRRLGVRAALLLVSLAMAGAAATASLALSAGAARAQIVNTQPLLTKGEASGLSGELSGSFEWRSGNVDLLRLGTSAILVWRACDHAVISSSEFELGDTSGERYLFRAFSHLRHLDTDPKHFVFLWSLTTRRRR